MPGLKREEDKRQVMVSPPKERSLVSPETGSLDPNQPIGITYVPQSNLENFLKAYQNHVLGLIDYGRVQPTLFDPHVLSLSVPMEQFHDPPLTEVWTSALPIAKQTVNGVQVAFNKEVVFGYIQCEELSGIALEEVVYSAYSRMMESLTALGYPHLFRLWNYFPAINAEQQGLERYKRFCIGRHRAFFERYRELKSFLPAASAIGTQSGSFQLYFLAGKPQALHIENPRQISAYDYPRMYGPKSPSFARATVASLAGCSYIFIAGTASIVGHATQHKDDCLKQTKETLSNLNSLMEHAKKTNPEVLRSNPSLSLLKVYVRHNQHSEIVKETIQEYVDHQIPILYLGAEMCRRNLLVEIEALYTIQHS